MTQEILIMVAILVAVILLTFIGILSRYRKCKSDEVLVVYGKTGRDKKSAKLYHGGAAFVWPIIQGYEFLSMKPMQIDCKLTGALSAQNIRVDVPTTITVAISTDPEVMQNAAERMLGLTMDDKQNLITDVVYGQMRLVIADMTIEELNSDRDKFLSKVKDNIDTELRKFGLYLMNINISDIRDAANYIVNLGKEAESKAQNEAQANIEEQEKLGAIKIANQIKERETKVAETRKDQDIAIAETKKLQEISVANADKDRISQVAIANAEKESQVAKAEAEKNIRIEQANTEKESRIAELNSDMEIKQAEAAKKAAIGRNDAQKEVALSNADLAVTQANADKQAGEAAARSEAAVQTAREIAQKEVEEAKARKVESSLKAEKIVPAEISRQEAILQANAIAEKITREAEARAVILVDVDIVVVHKIREHRRGVFETVGAEAAVGQNGVIAERGAHKIAARAADGEDVVQPVRIHEEEHVARDGLHLHLVDDVRLRKTALRDERAVVPVVVLHHDGDGARLAVVGVRLLTGQRVREHRLGRRGRRGFGRGRRLRRCGNGRGRSHLRRGRGGGFGGRAAARGQQQKRAGEQKRDRFGTFHRSAPQCSIIEIYDHRTHGAAVWFI